MDYVLKDVIAADRVEEFAASLRHDDAGADGGVSPSCKLDSSSHLSSDLLNDQSLH